MSSQTVQPNTAMTYLEDLRIACKEFGLPDDWIYALGSLIHKGTPNDIAQLIAASREFSRCLNGIIRTAQNNRFGILTEPQLASKRATQLSATTQVMQPVQAPPETPVEVNETSDKTLPASDEKIYSSRDAAGEFLEGDTAVVQRLHHTLIGAVSSDLSFAVFCSSQVRPGAAFDVYIANPRAKEKKGTVIIRGEPDTKVPFILPAGQAITQIVLTAPHLAVLEDNLILLIEINGAVVSLRTRIIRAYTIADIKKLSVLALGLQKEEQIITGPDKRLQSILKAVNDTIRASIMLPRDVLLGANVPLHGLGIPGTDILLLEDNVQIAKLHLDMKGIGIGVVERKLIAGKHLLYIQAQHQNSSDRASSHYCASLDVIPVMSSLLPNQRLLCAHN